MPYRQTERTEQRRAARRAQIVAAARKLFTLQGYEATTMQQVVTEAGTSIGNCYFYFRNKDELLAAVVDEFNAEIGRAIDAAFEATPAGLGQLAVAVYVGLVTVLNQADFARQILLETANPALRTRILAFFADRMRRFFTAHPTLLGQANPNWAALAWTGAAFNLLEKKLAGEISGEPADLGRFLARWNLQALGLPEPAVRQALAAIEQINH